MVNEIIDIPCSFFESEVTKHLGDPFFTGVIRDRDGDLAYFKDGVWHRDDGPALVPFCPPLIISVTIPSYWWLNGVSYRFDAWLKETNKTPEEKLLLQLTYG